MADEKVKGKVLGIDLGTTNSCMAIMEAGDPVVIQNSDGARTTPSVVFLGEERSVGQIAKRQRVLKPKQTIYSAKRLIGHTWDETENDRKNLAYETVKGRDNSVMIKVGDEEQTPQEVSAAVLRKLKEDAEKYLGTKIENAVITVPAYFNDSQRQATKDAGKVAGLNVLRIINEPTAAALAYGLEKKEEATILVFDLGGGTFDVSILELGDGVFEVKSSAGDSRLAGDDFDLLLVNYIADEFKKEQGIDIRNDSQALQRLTEAAEKAKIELSSLVETNISLPFITADASGPKHLEMKITRAKFEALSEGLLNKVKEPLNKAIADAKVSVSDINEVILVGGSTRIPAVQELVKNITGKEPHQGVNPDEVVAIGAAIQGGVLAGDVKDVVLLDVTPLGLGIETLGGVMTVLVERNTTIPTRKSEIFSTAEDNQTRVDIKVFQGERGIARENKLLGEFHLEGISAGARGTPKIEVAFDIDANGIVNVSAKDQASGKEQKISITASTNLTDEEINKMVKEAEEKSKEDEKFKEETQERNKADAIVYAAEKMVADLKDKDYEKEVSVQKEKVESEAKELRDLIKENADTEKLKQKSIDLQNAMMELNKAISEHSPEDAQKAAAEATAAAETAGATEEKKKGDDDDVIDAEFKATSVD